MTQREVMGQQTLIPTPLPLPTACLQGLTCLICPLPSVSLPHHRDIIRNCAVSVDQIQDLHSPMSPISENPASPAYSTGRHRPSIPLGMVRMGSGWAWHRCDAGTWAGGQSPYHHAAVLGLAESAGAAGLSLSSVSLGCCIPGAYVYVCISRL